MDKKAQRILAGFTCAAFVIVAFFSLIVIAKEAHHDCTGEDCPVCACIHQAEQTLKQIGTGSSETAGAFAPQFPLVVAFLCLPFVCTCRFPYQPEGKNEQLNRIL